MRRTTNGVNVNRGGGGGDFWNTYADSFSKVSI